MIKPLKQSTYETCLTCCLLMLAGKSRKDEIEIWKHGWKFNYLIGQINFVSSKYNKKVTAYIENKYYFNELKNQGGKNVRLINSKINLKLINKLLEEGSVGVYCDAYYPFAAHSGYVHAPHFIVCLSRDGDFMELADPWDGQIKKWPVKEINKAIISLRNHLKYSPVLITIN